MQRKNDGMNLRWKIAQAAEIRWWQSYLKNKPKADYLAWKLKYWQEMLQKLNLAFKNKEELLDAGCGPAGIFMALQDHPTDAMDPLMDEYEKNIEHFNPSLYPNTTFHNAALEVFAPGKKYDKIFCINAINHVANLGDSFDKLKTLTKAKGQLILSIDAHNYQGLKHIFRLLPGDILHPHQYDVEEYKQMLIDRNYEINQVVLYKKEFIFDYYVLVATLK